MKIYNLIFLGFIVASTISCSDKAVEPGEAVTIDDFVGSWNATSYVVTNNSDPSVELNLIALDAEFRFTMLEKGRVRTWFTLGTYSDEWDSQAELTDNGTLVLTPAETARGVDTLDYVIDNNTLELTNHNASFDFTLTGATEVPATSVMMFVRD